MSASSGQHIFRNVSGGLKFTTKILHDSVWIWPQTWQSDGCCYFFQAALRHVWRLGCQNINERLKFDILTRSFVTAVQDFGFYSLILLYNGKMTIRLHFHPKLPELHSQELLKVPSTRWHLQSEGPQRLCKFICWCVKKHRLFLLRPD